MKKLKKLYVFCFFITSIISLPSSAQCLIDIDSYMNELSRIKIAFRTLDSMTVLEFKTVEARQDSGMTSKFLSLLSTVYAGKYKTVGFADTAYRTAIFNNGSYTITIDSRDSLFIIEPADEFYDRTMLQSIFKPGFEQANLAAVCAHDSTTGFRVMNFQFTSSSYFKNFSLVYDTANYLVHKIQYSIKDFQNPSSHSYSETNYFYYDLLPELYDPVLPDFFISSTFFSIRNGKIVLNFPYESWKVYGSPIPDESSEGGGGIPY
jgi:hypothetical protein